MTVHKHIFIYFVFVIVLYRCVCYVLLVSIKEHIISIPLMCLIMFTLHKISSIIIHYTVKNAITCKLLLVIILLKLFHHIIIKFHYKKGHTQYNEGPSSKHSHL